MIKYKFVFAGLHHSTFRHCNIPYPLPAAFSIIVAAAATPYCLQLELSLKAPAQTSDKSRKICTQRRTFDRSGQGKCAGSFIWISSSFVTLDELHLLLLHLTFEMCQEDSFEKAQINPSSQIWLLGQGITSSFGILLHEMKQWSFGSSATSNLNLQED